MGKKQKHHNRNNSSTAGGEGPPETSSTNQNRGTSSSSSSSSSKQEQPLSFQAIWNSTEEWVRREQQGIVWVLGCISLGCLFGFGIGSGWLTGELWTSGSGASSIGSGGVAPWRIELGARIRSSLWYQVLFLWQPLSVVPGLRNVLFFWNGNNINDNNNINNPNLDYFSQSNSYHDNLLGGAGGAGGGSMLSSSSGSGPLHPSHPRVFAVLREAIVREKNGYVHPDLGILMPAPCGASRGIGMVRDSFQNCQSKCFPGVAKEKVDLRRNQQQKQLRNPENKTLWLPPISDKPVYKQEEVLIRVPLAFQMTRTVALDTIMARLPGEVQRKASPHELDDAALLVLLLAHERGVGRHSRWLPYIASLPKEPSCGYSPKLRPYMLNAVNILQEELGVDTYGWKGELIKAHKHASKIANGLAKDYGPHIKTPEGMTVVENIEWALCQVNSRATAGSEQYGALRMVPMMDMINHDANAGAFVELTGKERLAHGSFVDATEDDAGTFVVRSLRHGKRKALKKGQELLVNYNVPHYSPLDWFVSLGFVPSERQTQWQKIDAALPRVRQDSYGVTGGDKDGSKTMSTEQLWNEEYGPELLAKYKDYQKRKRQMSKSSSSTNNDNDNNNNNNNSGKDGTTNSGTDNTENDKN